MGKKYIIEIGRLERLYKAFISAYGKPEITWLSPEVDLTPYTEPDLEQVRKEAYEDGYKTAKVQCNIQAEKDLREVGERHYQKGLSDAWDAAKKIYLPVEYGGIPADALRQIFNNKSASGIFKKVSASEAIEKIRQYEQEKKEKEEQIQVGDEVIIRYKKAVVTEITDSFVRIMYSDGSGYALFSKNMTKTGRNFPEIAEILAKMKESANEN